MADLVDCFKQRLSGPAVLLFGPLELSFNNVHFIQIRETILANQSHQWILEILTELPHHWKIVASYLPHLGAGPGLKSLEQLKDAFLLGQSLEKAFPLPNTALIPLNVIFHLTQYAAFLEHTRAELDNHVDLFAASDCNMETLGICTGILSALAVSCTKSKDEFCKFGAISVRLGMLIGMIVDARDANSKLGASKSLTTAWNSVDGGTEMRRILHSFPGV